MRVERQGVVFQRNQELKDRRYTDRGQEKQSINCSRASNEENYKTDDLN